MICFLFKNHVTIFLEKEKTFMAFFLGNINPLCEGTQGRFFSFLASLLAWASYTFPMTDISDRHHISERVLFQSIIVDFYYAAYYLKIQGLSLLQPVTFLLSFHSISTTVMGTIEIVIQDGGMSYSCFLEKYLCCKVHLLS